jgi:Spy/CpxP family protein refolding chaperone
MQERRENQKSKLAERIKQLQLLKLTERLKLTEEQTTKFFPRYTRYQDEFTREYQSLQSQIRELEELQVSAASESEIDKKVQAVLESREITSSLLIKYFKEFREVLTARQMAELVIFERDFLRDLSKLMKEARDGK